MQKKFPGKISCVQDSVDLRDARRVRQEQKTQNPVAGRRGRQGPCSLHPREATVVQNHCSRDLPGPCVRTAWLITQTTGMQHLDWDRYPVCNGNTVNTARCCCPHRRHPNHGTNAHKVEVNGVAIATKVTPTFIFHGDTYNHRPHPVFISSFGKPRNCAEFAPCFTAQLRSNWSICAQLRGNWEHG